MCGVHVRSVDRKRDKLEREVMDSQERAFWDLHRPMVRPSARSHLQPPPRCTLPAQPPLHSAGSHTIRAARTILVRLRLRSCIRSRKVQTLGGPWDCRGAGRLARALRSQCSCVRCACLCSREW